MSELKLKVKTNADLVLVVEDKEYPLQIQEDCLVQLIESAKNDIKEGRSYSVEEALTKLKNSRNNQGE